MAWPLILAALMAAKGAQGQNNAAMQAGVNKPVDLSNEKMDLTTPTVSGGWKDAATNMGMSVLSNKLGAKEAETTKPSATGWSNRIKTGKL